MKLIFASILTLALMGCGATPVFLGDADDGTMFIARLTEFQGTAGTGIMGGVTAQGCQISMRGPVPKGVAAQLFAGRDCTALVELPKEVVSDPVTEIPFDFDIEGF